MRRRILVWFWRITKKTVMAGCGHKTLVVGTIIIEGQKRVFALDGNAQPECCLDCFQKSIINCAHCGFPIVPGEPITLYEMAEDFVPKEGSRKYGDEYNCHIGCMRFDCADTGMDRAGFWEYPGMVRRVQNIYETILADPTIKMAICPDLTKDRVDYIT